MVFFPSQSQTLLNTAGVRRTAGARRPCTLITRRKPGQFQTPLQCALAITTGIAAGTSILSFRPHLWGDDTAVGDSEQPVQYVFNNNPDDEVDGAGGGDEVDGARGGGEVDGRPGGGEVDGRPGGGEVDDVTLRPKVRVGHSADENEDASTTPDELPKNPEAAAGRRRRFRPLRSSVARRLRSIGSIFARPFRWLRRRSKGSKTVPSSPVEDSNLNKPISYSHSAPPA